MSLKIQELESSGFKRAYGGLVQEFFTGDDAPKTPFGATWMIVEPGERTQRHRHHEAETWIITQGDGIVTSGDEHHPVKQGNVVYFPPLDDHTLENTSQSDDLQFLAVYWEDLSLLESELPGTDAEPGKDSQRPVLITATPPTPNGDLHIGHLSGPYLAADIYRRFLRMRGRPAHYLCGIDDHQSYVAYRAKQLDKSPRQTADDFGAAMFETLQAANIETDAFAFPAASPYHQEMVQEFFTKLYLDDKLVAKDAPTLFCPHCDQYAFEVYVAGACPHCASGSCGNACENCGQPNDCVDLIDPKCNSCDGELEQRILRRLYFPLGQYHDQLKAYVESATMNAHLRSLCETMLAGGLPDIAISQFTDWGIPVPFAGFEGQRLYAWAEMAPGYLAATEQLASEVAGQPGWKSFWQGDPSEVVQFFGFDNGYFHAILFPALYFAYDPSIVPPSTFVMNEFYRLDGLKFSTSRQHLIWGRDLLAKTSIDMVRFYLSYSAPETEQTNFTHAEMSAILERELIDSWSPWLQELASKVHDEYGGSAPSTGLWTIDQQQFFELLTRLTRDAEAAYEAPTFSPQRATRALCELVRTTRRFAAAEAHWKGFDQRRDERRTAVALELTAAKTLAMLAAPILPDFAERLWRNLGSTSPLQLGSWRSTPEFLAAGSVVVKTETPYFPKLPGDS